MNIIKYKIKFKIMMVSDRNQVSLLKELPRQKIAAVMGVTRPVRNGGTLTAYPQESYKWEGRCQKMPAKAGEYINFGDFRLIIIVNHKPLFDKKAYQHRTAMYEEGE